MTQFLLAFLSVVAMPTLARAQCSASPPSHVQEALEETRKFMMSCSTAQIGDDKHILINDYSGQSMPPKMYVFTKTGNCIREMEITWGVGQSGSGTANGKPAACSEKSTQQTPPGYHITAKHAGGERYNENNSIGLAALSGQKSLGDRGILIHGAEQPGTASSWGCTGVPNDKFDDLKKLVGYGSLVNNYFGKPANINCGNKAGGDDKCEPEEAARNAASGKSTPSSGGGSTPSSRPSSAPNAR